MPMDLLSIVSAAILKALRIAWMKPSREQRVVPIYQQVITACFGTIKEKNCLATQLKEMQIHTRQNMTSFLQLLQKENINLLTRNVAQKAVLLQSLADMLLIPDKQLNGMRP
ncbi:hypothetical protein D3C71_1471380 [compost metagenome]